MPTLSPDELTAVADTARSTVPHVYGHCIKIASALLDALNSHGVPTEHLGRCTVYLGAHGTIPHTVVVTKAQHVPSTGGGSVFVDAALDQFCDANRDAGHVDVALGPRSEIPPVNVFPSLVASPYSDGDAPGAKLG